jgi:hypothetical protein
MFTANTLSIGRPFYLAAVMGIVILGALAPAAARAQGVEVFSHLERPGFKSQPSKVLSRPTLIADLVAELNDRRPQIEGELRMQLGRGDLLGKGYTLYKLNPRLGEASFQFDSPSSFRIRMPGNYLYARCTQPTVLGSGADPAVEIHFDLLVTGTFELPTHQRPTINVTTAVVQVPRVTVKSRNVSGAVVIGSGVIYDFFNKKVTGRSIIQDTFNKIAIHDVTSELNDALAGVNKQLKKLHDQGHRASTRLDGQVLKITMHRKLTPADLVKAKVQSPIASKLPITEKAKADARVTKLEPLPTKAVESPASKLRPYRYQMMKKKP